MIDNHELDSNFWISYDYFTLESPPKEVWQTFNHLLGTHKITEEQQEMFLDCGLKFIIFESKFYGNLSYYAFKNETDYNAAILIS